MNSIMSLLGVEFHLEGVMRYVLPVVSLCGARGTLLLCAVSTVFNSSISKVHLLQCYHA